MDDPTSMTHRYGYFGHGENLLRRRYEYASIINDILIAAWFIIGSLLFFDSSTATAGTWMFLIGSVELLIRPIIRLIRKIHLRQTRPISAHESDQDF